MNLLNYIKGVRKGENARRIEIDAMRDPFLSEAIDGYDSVKGDHIARIAQMQKMVESRSRSNKIVLRSISIAAVAAIACFIVYFDIFNQTQTNIDNNTLYVYVPENYMQKKQSFTDISPKVEIKNIDEIIDVELVEIYVPQEYIERRKQENLEQKEESTENTPIVITNLDQIFAPEKPIDIYIPDNRYRSSKTH